jgi:hypothetical protein
MRFHQVRWCMGLSLCLTGLALFTWGAWPAGKSQKVLLIQPGEMQIPLAGWAPAVWEGNVRDTPTTVPAILEVRRLALETPRFLRSGDAGEVRLEFSTDLSQKVDGEIAGLSNLYDTHQVAVEARLEMGGLQVDPSGTLTRPLEPGQTVKYTWILRPEQAQVYKGAAWFYLRFMPKDGSPSSDWPLAVQRIELYSTSLLGLTGRLARWLGGMGVLVGLLLLADLLTQRLHRRGGVESFQAAG